MGTSTGAATTGFTDTLNVVAPWFPAASFAVQVTDVLPMEKNEPDSGVQTGPNVTPWLSVTSGLA